MENKKEKMMTDGKYGIQSRYFQGFLLDYQLGKNICQLDIACIK